MNENELYDNAIKALDELYEMLDSRATKIDTASALWVKEDKKRVKVGKMYYWVSKMKKKEMKE
tara:strand:- start:603 stop:791 length:189 start_codon:yes stop_codon:yes gene_type:complete